MDIHNAARCSPAERRRDWKPSGDAARYPKCRCRQPLSGEMCFNSGSAHAGELDSLKEKISGCLVIPVDITEAPFTVTLRSAWKKPQKSRRLLWLDTCLIPKPWRRLHRSGSEGKKVLATRNQNQSTPAHAFNERTVIALLRALRAVLRERAAGRRPLFRRHTMLTVSATPLPSCGA